MEPIPRLGKRVQRLREQRGLSITELAARAKTTYQTIWRIERGEQKDPSVALVRGIARGLGVGVDYLIEMFTEEEEESHCMPTAAVLIGVWNHGGSILGGVTASTLNTESIPYDGNSVPDL